MARRVFLFAIAAVAVLAIWKLRLLPGGVPLSGEWGAEADRIAAAGIVRAAYAGTPVEAGRLPSEPGRRVFVTAFGPAWSLRETALEATTAAGLEKAARLLGEKVRAGSASGRGPVRWLVVDVVAGTQPLGRDPSQDRLELLYETGVDGLLVESGDSLAAVLPGDPITEGWFSPRVSDPKRQGGSRWFTRGDEGMRAKDTARTRLAQSTGAKPDASQLRWTRFRTDSFLFAPSGTEPPTPLYRGMPVGPVIPEPEAIHTAAIAGGEWLVAQLDSSGMFQYTYVPNRDQDTPPGSYSFIRHTATAWMMVRLGRRFDRPEWSDAAYRALAWTEKQIVPAALAHAGRGDRNLRRWIVAAPREAKGGLGHNAVTVIALLEEKERLSPEQLAKVKGIGATLEMMLRCESRTDADPCVGGDGGFFENESENLGRPNTKKDSLLYEPGEGLLALVTLAEAFPDEAHWMESALVSAEYQANKFLNARPPYWFQGKMAGRLRFVDRVHWQTMALEKLARLTGDDHWADVTVQMGEAILMSGTPPNEVVVTGLLQPVGPAPWDYSGGFPLPGRIPRTTPTGSRAEALNAARRAAILIGKNPAPFEAMLKRTAGLQLRNQFTDVSCYFCPKPEKARGAFRAGLTDNEIRIDFIQHVIAGQADTLEWYGAPAE